MGRCALAVFLLGGLLFAQAPDTAFFEARIRPVLVAKCYACHASTLATPASGLSLDTRAGVLKGGDGGTVIVPGKPAESRLLSAIRYNDADLQMPPNGKLSDSTIGDFETWIASGAPDPRTGPSTAAKGPAPLKGMSIADGRKWWAFQPVHEWPAPAAADPQWAKTKIDSFILAKLAEKSLKPSPPADAAVLVTRAYVDLLGYKPTYAEVQAFVKDSSPKAYENLIERLLASPHYGEAWGRHWMDVARYGEDNSTGEATNTPYPYAWRYRDWIIESLNRDVPFDRFVKLQLAADLMPGATRADERALGYLGAAQVYHKDQRLSHDVVYGFLTDDWDERIDAVSRGLLGMTVACARCHDHKFDPIPTKDYYGMAGMFASTMRAERPTFDVPPEIEQRFLWVQRRLQDLRYSADLLTNEASTVVGSEARVVKWKAEIESLRTEVEGWHDRYPQLVDHLERFWTFPPPKPANPPPAAAAAPRRRRASPTDPFMNTVYDCAQYVDGTDKNYTMIVYKAGEARDLPVMMHGNVASPGEIAPRHFLTVLSNGDTTFHQGSGRREFADDLFTDGAPLAARVIVNRVWGWHFGKPLVATPSDFGVQGEKPTHPELLDDLAARFIAHGWSLKWLHREIMLSATYRQASQPRPDAEAGNPGNTLLWRMNPRRLDIEAFRDTLLRSAGQLSEEMYGPSADLDSPTDLRRTVYGKVSRSRLNNLLRQYDFPDPMQTSGGRDLTITSLQQLFLMNSPFLHNLSGTLAKSVAGESDVPAKVRALYRKILSRDPSAKELELAVAFLNGSSVDEYAQVLLSTNEEIFWQ